MEPDVCFVVQEVENSICLCCNVDDRIVTLSKQWSMQVAHCVISTNTSIKAPRLKATFVASVPSFAVAPIQLLSSGVREACAPTKPWTVLVSVHPQVYAYRERRHILFHDGQPKMEACRLYYLSLYT